MYLHTNGIQASNMFVDGKSYFAGDIDIGNEEFPSNVNLNGKMELSSLKVNGDVDFSQAKFKYFVNGSTDYHQNVRIGELLVDSLNFTNEFCNFTTNDEMNVNNLTFSDTTITAKNNDLIFNTRDATKSIIMKSDTVIEGSLSANGIISNTINSNILQSTNLIVDTINAYSTTINIQSPIDMKFNNIGSIGIISSQKAELERIIPPTSQKFIGFEGSINMNNEYDIYNIVNTQTKYLKVTNGVVDGLKINNGDLNMNQNIIKNAYEIQSSTLSVKYISSLDSSSINVESPIYLYKGAYANTMNVNSLELNNLKGMNGGTINLQSTLNGEGQVIKISTLEATQLKVISMTSLESGHNINVETSLNFNGVEKEIKYLDVLNTRKIKAVDNHSPVVFESSIDMNHNNIENINTVETYKLSGSVVEATTLAAYKNSRITVDSPF